MLICNCIEKFKDKNGNIVGYRLQTASGETKDFKADEVKYYIKNFKMHVNNLKLTADNRLIDKSSSEETMRFKCVAVFGTYDFDDFLVVYNEDTSKLEYYSIREYADICKNKSVISDVFVCRSEYGRNEIHKTNGEKPLKYNGDRQVVRGIVHNTNSLIDGTFLNESETVEISDRIKRSIRSIIESGTNIDNKSTGIDIIQTSQGPMLDVTELIQKDNSSIANKLLKYRYGRIEDTSLYGIKSGENHFIKLAEADTHSKFRKGILIYNPATSTIKFAVTYFDKTVEKHYISAIYPVNYGGLAKHMIDGYFSNTPYHVRSMLGCLKVDLNETNCGSDDIVKKYLHQYKGVATKQILNNPYLRACEEYHKEFTRDELIERVKSFLSKEKMLGINNVDFSFALCNGKVFITRIRGRGSVNINVPNFVFGFMSDGSNLEATYGLWDPEITSIKIRFARPLVVIPKSSYPTEVAESKICSGLFENTNNLRNIELVRCNPIHIKTSKMFAGSKSIEEIDFGDEFFNDLTLKNIDVLNPYSLKDNKKLYISHIKAGKFFDSLDGIKVKREVFGKHWYVQ